MNKLIIVLGLALNFSYCFSATDGIMVGNDSRVREFYYKDSEIYNIYLSEGKALVIEFEPGEEVIQKGIGIGNAGAIDVGKNKNILMVKPKSINYNTNLIVVTNKRNYVFNVLKPTNQNVALYKVIFNYSGRVNNYSIKNKSKKSKGFFDINNSKKENKANTYSHLRTSTVYNKRIDEDINNEKLVKNTKNANLPPAIKIIPPTKNEVQKNFSELKPNSSYDYIVKGDRELIPVAIFDDGHSLHMAFTTKKHIPLVYKLDNRNRQRLVRPKINNNIVIINEIPYITILKKDNKLLQIKRMSKEVIRSSKSL